MGHKVHPMGFRIGVIRDWQAKWYADKHYAEFIQEDFKLRQAINSKYPDAGISQVEINRQANEVFVTIHTSRPGVVIGRGGQRVDEMRLYLQRTIGKRVRLNIVEVHQPELDGTLVAKTVADQIVHRVAYRRAMKQAIGRALQAGAKGIRISAAGRLAGAEIARRLILHDGRVPLHTLRADIDYGFAEAHTTLGQIGVKVWIYKGDILPQAPAAEISEAAAAEVTEAPVPGPTEPAATVSGPAAGVSEAPAEAVAAATTGITPEVAKPVEAPAAPVTEKAPEPLPAAKAEEKPAPARTRRPARPAAEKQPEPTPVAKAEEKPSRTRTRRPAQPAAEKQPEPTPVAKAEEKPSRTRTRVAKKEVPATRARGKTTSRAAGTVTEAEPAAKVKEDKDATTEAG